MTASPDSGSCPPTTGMLRQRRRSLLALLAASTDPCDAVLAAQGIREASREIEITHALESNMEIDDERATDQPNPNTLGPHRPGA